MKFYLALLIIAATMIYGWLYIVKIIAENSAYFGA